MVYSLLTSMSFVFCRTISTGAVKIVSGNLLGRTRTATLVVEEKYLNFDKGGAYATAFLLALVSVACIVVVAIIRPDSPDSDRAED